MSRTTKRIFLIILSLTIGLSCLTYVSNITQGDVIYEDSDTMEQSKEKGYFLTEYRPMTRKIKLRHHTDSVEFIRLWTENRKKKEKVWLFYRTVPSDYVHFQIDFRQYPLGKYDFSIYTNNGHVGEDGSIETDFEEDTVTFQIVEREFLTQEIKFIRNHDDIKNAR